jgi:hypothetical protein
LPARRKGPLASVSSRAYPARESPHEAGAANSRNPWCRSNKPEVVLWARKKMPACRDFRLDRQRCSLPSCGHPARAPSGTAPGAKAYEPARPASGEPVLEQVAAERRRDRYLRSLAVLLTFTNARSFGLVTVWDGPFDLPRLDIRDAV